MDYQIIGKTLETTGKEIQKLNNKLDKILEKLLEVEALEERKAEAIGHIESGRIGEAIALLKTVEKDQSKAEDLKQEEASLREQLEELRDVAARAATGDVGTDQKATPAEEADPAEPGEERDSNAA